MDRGRSIIGGGGGPNIHKFVFTNRKNIQSILKEINDKEQEYMNISLTPPIIKALLRRGAFHSENLVNLAKKSTKIQRILKKSRNLLKIKVNLLNSGKSLKNPHNPLQIHKIFQKSTKIL